MLQLHMRRGSLLVAAGVMVMDVLVQGAPSRVSPGWMTVTALHQ